MIRDIHIYDPRTGPHTFVLVVGRRRSHEREIMKKRSWKSNHGGGIIEEEWIVEEKLWKRSHGGEIQSRNHGAAVMEEE